MYNVMPCTNPTHAVDMVYTHKCNVYDHSP